jgi:eukaryotic-like serine/threonine-protein kinase
MLGRGGMADVVAADDIETGQTVAVKVMRLEVEDHAFDRRFLQELLAAAQVDHATLVPVLDFGVSLRTHRPFFAMEMLHGMELASHLEAYGPFRASTLLPLFCFALDGLEAVHRLDIVHRDIKPANLFLDQPTERAPMIRITDFGIAHHMQRSRATHNGALVCTPRYSSPEYITMGTVRPASDVYQMGLVLAECLLGWPMVPQVGFVAEMNAHTRGELQLPHAFVASPIGSVLKQALALEPADRFPTAGAFATALRALEPATADVSLELIRALQARRIRSA